MGKHSLGKRIFSFAVIADSHLNQNEAGCNSPFPVNELANKRMRHVVRDINARNVDFTIHLGDLIHPVPAVQHLYQEAAKRFHEQVAKLDKPLYLTPGNHDIGDKPMPWAPAGCITQDYRELWHNTFGKDYYAFAHKNIHVIVLNAQLCNSGLPAEAHQEAWLAQELADHAKQRIFICTHYPLFMYAADEAEHYDNVAQPARERILTLLRNSKTEAIFAGHVHNFWYLRHDNVCHYLLPSTAFVRQDYSEMLKAPPPSDRMEAGRNDTAKLGYFIVHIHEHGHTCRMIRTYGTYTEETTSCTLPTEPLPHAVEKISPLENRCPALGFDLRQSWADAIAIPPSGALDEFDRKDVRNDYPLLGLWEMGVQHLRIPLQDLRKEHTRQRIQDLLPLGHKFTLFSFGIPTNADKQYICQYQNMLCAWELTFHKQDIDTLAHTLSTLQQEIHVPIFLSRMWEHEENKSPDGRYFHVMNHGFSTDDHALLQHMDTMPSLKNIGLVFRIMRHENIYEKLNACIKLGTQYARPLSVHMRMTGHNPAVAIHDDVGNAQILAEALFCTAYKKDIRIFVDTLTDIDRGYFVRNGVLDNLCNPRQGARFVAHLYGALHEGQGPLENIAEVQDHENGNRWLWTRQGQDIIALFFPKNGSTALQRALDAFFATEKEKNKHLGPVNDITTVYAIDLDSGLRVPLHHPYIISATPTVYFVRAHCPPT